MTMKQRLKLSTTSVLLLLAMQMSVEAAFTSSFPARHEAVTRTTTFTSIMELQMAATLDTEKQQQQQPKQRQQGKKKTVSFQERITNSGAASAAAMATAAVNAAVAMRTLEAPDMSKSYIALDHGHAINGEQQQQHGQAKKNLLDEEGLPLVYDKDLIQQYWDKERGALNQRWSVFVGKAVPFLTKLVTLFIRDGKIDDSELPALSKRARLDIEELGATFIKAGQMMSIRPDVLPQATLDELVKLQDSVVPFSTEIAVQQIELELGGPLGQFFTSISQEPVAAASLAQVYLATLSDGKDTKVAVKVQRPSVLGTVSKDLYVLRRAAEVWQGLVERFAPQQKTNYVALLNEWAIGFYTELDFSNEARNQIKLRQDLIENDVKGIMVPRVYEELCTRRILVSEWVEGEKLSASSPQEIAKLTPIAQEAFLVQLFETGFFHADPHPGNLMKLHEPTEEGHELAIIDCGLMASIDPVDRDNMISTLIHLANKDYASLVDDFIRLKILPEDCNRPAVIPLMDKALSPYVKGGGAKRYEQELKKMYGMEENDTLNAQVGGFQAMTQDALTVLNDIPFSIPPYFAILGRAVVTLEGVALTGNPDYGLIMEAYPFIARKLLREDRPEIQSALQEVLYGSGDISGDSSKDFKLSRLLTLLNNAAGSVSTQEGAAFVDLDTVPQDGITFSDGLKYLLSDRAESLRALLEAEVDNIVDILSRQIFRKGMTEAMVALAPPRPPALPFLGDVSSLLPPAPKLDEVPLPILVPQLVHDNNSQQPRSTTPTVSVMTLKEFTHLAAPPLTQDEDLYAISLAEAAKEFFGEEVGALVQGDGLWNLQTATMIMGLIRSGALGNSDLLSSATAQATLTFVSNTISAATSVLRTTNVNDGNKLEDEISRAIQELNTQERARLDEILTEITARALQRLSERLSSKPSPSLSSPSR